MEISFLMCNLGFKFEELSSDVLKKDTGKTDTEYRKPNKYSKRFSSYIDIVYSENALCLKFVKCNFLMWDIPTSFCRNEVSIGIKKIENWFLRPTTEYIYGTIITC